MSDRYDQEILLEEYDHVTDRRSFGVGGMLTGFVLTALVLFGLYIGGRAAADWLSGLGGFDEPAPEAVQIDPGAIVVVDVPSGASARQISRILVENGVIASAEDFEGAISDRGASSQLKAGGYEFAAGSDYDGIIDILIDGPNLTTVRVTIVEGRRIGEVMEDLANQTSYTADEFIAALLDGSVESIYLPEGVSGLQAWEGLLFPDTYEFFAASTPPEILQRLSNEMERNISALDWTFLMAQGLTIYDGIVIASMIEAEASVDGDRPLISSVLQNRLDDDMLLQIDATVLYALGERRSGLTLDDLEVDSEYNTYLTPGLPPTPIGAPGFASLSAASSPAASDFLFYVLTSADGSHTFTVTYEEFLEAKEQAQDAGILP